MTTHFILSIDGGGIRGIIPAAILVELAARLDKRGRKRPLHHYFGLIAGTSTGAIIAAGLTCPHPEDPTRPAATPEELLALYVDEGADIFNRSAMRSLFNPWGLDEERYSHQALEGILRARLGNALIRDAHGKVMITAYDITARRAVFMSNTDDEHASIRFWQAVRGSSAAPTFFEPAPVEDLATVKNNTSKVMYLVDGGVFANDPALAAYVEALKLKWNKRSDTIIMLSLGTGAQTRPIPYQEAKDWGAVGWISPTTGTPLISILMQGQASTAAYQANTILNPAYPEMPDGATRVTAGNRRKLRYFRIDGPLRRNYDDPLQGPNDALDDAGPDNIVALKAFAAALIKKHTMALDEMVERIVAVFKN